MKKPDLSSLKLSNIDIRKYRVSNFKQYEKQKIAAYLYIIYTLFAVSIFGFFAINPTLSTISNRQKQYEDNKIVEKALNEKITAMNSLSLQYLRIKPSLELVYTAIPTSTQIPSFERQIETLAEKDGINIILLNFETVELYPSNKDKFLYEITFDVSADSPDSKSISKFITDLTNMGRIINVNIINETFNPSFQKDNKNPFNVLVVGK